MRACSLMPTLIIRVHARVRTCAYTYTHPFLLEVFFPLPTLWTDPYHRVAIVIIAHFLLVCQPLARGSPSTHVTCLHTYASTPVSLHLTPPSSGSMDIEMRCLDEALDECTERWLARRFVPCLIAPESKRASLLSNEPAHQAQQRARRLGQAE